jgi:hypothetical protein
MSIQNNLPIKSQKEEILTLLRGEKVKEGLFQPATAARSLPGSYIPSFNLFGLEALNINGGADNLFSIPNLDYYLELYYNDDLITTIGFPYNPAAITFDTMPSVKLTHNSGQVYREAGFSRARNIQISGKSGYATRLGYARDGGYIFENGEVIMHEFDEFLKGYHYLLSLTSSNTYLNRAQFSKKIFPGNQDLNTKRRGGSRLNYLKTETNTDDASGFILVLRCVNENISLRVEVNSFNYSKNASSQKFGYDYSLSLNSYGLWGPGRRSNPYLDAIDKVTGYINKASTALALLEALNVNVANNYISPLNKPIRATNQLLDQFSKTVQSTGVITGAAFEVANNAVNLFQRIDNTILTTNTDKNILTTSAATVGDDFKTQLRQLKDTAYNDDRAKAENRKRAQKNALPVIETTDSALNIKVDDTSIDAKNIEIMRKMLSNVDYDIAFSDDNKIELGLLTTTLNTLRYQMEGIKSIIPKDYVAINRDIDDNLSFGESSEFGDNSQFFIPLRLKENENLKDVARRLYGDPNQFLDLMRFNGWLNAHIKGDGSHAIAGDIIKVPNNNPQFNFIDNVFYTDLFSNINDIVFNIDKNDLYLSSNLDNLKQAIINYFLTYQGELENDIRLGLANLIGVKNLEFVKTNIKNQLLGDERIRSVDILDIKQVKDELYLSLKVIAIDGQVLDFTTSIEI